MATVISPTKDQAHALKLLDAGGNVFLTGVAGTGKTWTLNRWLETARIKGANIAVTASTGIAAAHIDGMTVHRWSGWGIGQRKVGEIVESGYWRRRIKPAIRATDILVVDEVSMLDGKTFTALDKLCQLGRGNLEPFGNIQVVLVGDMGQLPPVEEEEHGYAFDTEAWSEARFRVVRLETVLRQSDPWFVWVLQCARVGVWHPAALELLTKRVRVYDPVAVGAVRLMTHNRMVDDVNQEHLAELEGELGVFQARENGGRDHLEKLAKRVLSPRRLELKEGARVMLTRNASSMVYVNGSLGTVEELPHEGHPDAVTVRLDRGPLVYVERVSWHLYGRGKNGELVTLATLTQFPLRLAWAMTIHKSQGMTIERVSVDLADCFAPGQAYVALSRAVGVSGLNIERWRNGAEFKPTRGATMEF